MIESRIEEKRDEMKIGKMKRKEREQKVSSIKR